MYYFNILKVSEVFQMYADFVIFTVQHLRSQPHEGPGLTEVIVIMPLFLKGPE